MADTYVKQFKVSPGQIAVVSASNLTEEDKLNITRLLDDDACDIATAQTIPFSPYGEVVTIDANHNPVVINIPGYYRIAPVGFVNERVEIYVHSYRQITSVTPIQTHP